MPMAVRASDPAGEPSNDSDFCPFNNGQYIKHRSFSFLWGIIKKLFFLIKEALPL